MIEVLFSEFVASSMKLAKYYDAVSCHPVLGDVFPMSMALSVGDLKEDYFGAARQKAILCCQGRYPLSWDKAKVRLDRARTNFEEVKKRAENGEDVRIWCSDSQQDDQCGFRWLVSELFPCKNRGKIWVVNLPSYEIRLDGEVLLHVGWGDVDTETWAEYTRDQKTVSDRYCEILHDEWKNLVKENAPLRMPVCGKLYSVPEDFFDFLILNELALQPQEFYQATVVSNICNKSTLLPGWIAMRMEKWVQEGILEPVPDCGKDDSGFVYRRYLRKVKPLPTHGSGR